MYPSDSDSENATFWQKAELEPVRSKLFTYYNRILANGDGLSKLAVTLDLPEEVQFALYKAGQQIYDAGLEISRAAPGFIEAEVAPWDDGPDGATRREHDRRKNNERRSR